MRLEVSSDAQQDLDEIWDYLAQYHEATAERQLALVRRKFLNLVAMPFSGPQRDFSRVLVAGNYNIFYRITGDVIEILRVLHGRRDCETLMSGTDADD